MRCVYLYSLFVGGAEGEPPLKPFELLGYEGPAGGYPGAEFGPELEFPLNFNLFYNKSRYQLTRTSR